MVELAPAGDARIAQVAPDSFEGTNGILSVYTVGNNVQRTLIRFDLSSLPAGQAIVSAVLTLYTWNTQGAGYTNPDPQPMEIYRMTRPWDEATVTWNQASSTPGDTWTGANGAYVGTTGAQDTSPYATSLAQPVLDNTPVTWTITQLAQEWYSGAQPNYGLFLRSYQGNQVHFNSREASDPQIRPVLEVTLADAAVPEPGSLALLAVAGVVLAASRLRRRCA